MVDKEKVVVHPNVCTLMTGIFNSRPPQAKYTFIWDVQIVLNFIKDNSSLYQVFTRGTIMGETPANDAWDIAKSHPLIVNFE